MQMQMRADGQDPVNLLQNQIEELSRKFFVGPGDDEKFKKWGEIAMELALDWQKNPEKKKIHADISLPELSTLFEEIHPPDSGEKIEDVFRECKEKILDNSVRINNPRYVGHMSTATPWFSVVVDILITSINQNQVKIETALASSFVERQTLSWMHNLVYQREDSFYQKNIQNTAIAFGNITSGGTMGNLTALAVAREKALPGLREKGFFRVVAQSGYAGVAILASQRVHYSVTKSAAILGLGDDSVIKIPVDEDNRIDTGKLQEKIEELRAENILIIALVGIAGTTETGNIDPLLELGRIAKKENIWFHVDAAWGGALLVSPDLRGKLAGIEEADSVVLDGHKLFYLAMAHSAVVFKDTKALDTWRHNANYIIRKGSVDIGQTSFEGSRRFNALKLWFSLKMLGVNGYNALLTKALSLTEDLKQIVDQDPDFERTSNPEICILTYRFCPQEWMSALNDPAQATEINKKINAINVEIQKRQRENGISFISRTILESTKHSTSIVVLRAVLTNLLTKTEYLTEMIEEQRSLGRQILSES